MSKSSSDVVKLCPMCKSDVKYFFVNFSEKILLCENEHCIYPLGCEELQFIEIDTGIKLDEGASGLARRKKSGSPSLASDLADIVKLHKVLEWVKNEFDGKPTTSKKMKMSDIYIANNKEIKKDIQELKNLIMELNETCMIKDENDFIKTEKWLKKLINLEGSSGVKLVKKKKMKLEQKTTFDGGKLKSDIDSNTNNISSVDTQITNKDGDRTTLEDAT